MSPSVNHRSAALAVLCAMSLMIVLDSTIVAVAVPDIQRELGFSPAGVSWVVNAYLVAFAGLLLLAGRLGDLLGAWRVFLAGLALFTVASLLCGLAPTAGWLVSGRFVQGAGGALAAAVVIGMIVRLFPEPGAQARAMGIYSFTQAGGAALGFVAGGVLTDAVGWPVIFLVNVPIGAAVYLAGRRLLPRESGPGFAAGLDLPGAALITAGLSSGVYAIIASSPLAGVLAPVLIVAFLLRQRYARRPLIALRVLSRRWLLIANAAVLLIFATGMGFQFLNALFVQRVMGYDALGTGLAFLPTPLVIGIVSLFVAPRVTARFGPRPVLLAGLSLFLVGLLLLARMPVEVSYVADMLPPLIVMGLGVGVTVPAIIMLAMAGAAPADTGTVSGFTNTAQQAGGALGLSILAVVAANRTAGSTEVAALHDGYVRAFLVAAGFVVAALLITALLLRRPPAGEQRCSADGDGEDVHAGLGGGHALADVGQGEVTDGLGRVERD
ncbi:EmrB/QacA subfamily drug resistance transporter [Actinoplanes tereljensis]|uniref:MFS transporter n=1 Tax=Paractinoplanes tereljensis TaxID=571912 RepID=A0A919TTC3_9ACTN|nr:MFS transporter [Actinoplanes tereljensis]GIF21124.1 MFS transporter [Actinoplanes tereljensis]